MVFWGVQQSGLLETKASTSFSGSAWTWKSRYVAVAKRSSFKSTLTGDSDAFMHAEFQKRGNGWFVSPLSKLWRTCCCSGWTFPLCWIANLHSAEWSLWSDHVLICWSDQTAQCEMCEWLRGNRKVPSAVRSHVWEAAVRTGGPAGNHTLVLIGFVNRMLVF